jgi:DedD protein
MPPESANDDVLSLKKRARRRLVGAIALVLLMIIVLPMILQDRASLAPQDAIKITMLEVHKNVVDANVDNQALSTAAAVALTPEEPTRLDEANQVNVIADEVIVNEKVKNEQSETDKKNVENKNVVSKLEKKSEIKEKVTKLAEVKLAETSTKPSLEAETQGKIQTGFTIQVGVYSDAANVKQLQAKLKEAGYVSHTEKITTAKGEKIRLRAGSFPSHQEAADALVKLQGSGLPGMVISN